MANKKVVKTKKIKKVKISFVKVYITEGDKLLHLIMNYLHNEVKVKGVTVTRAITGFGKSGAMHSSEILSMSLDLPLIIEFFDVPKKVNIALQRLQTILPSGHIVVSSAECI